MIDRGKTCLLVVDVQTGLIDDHPYNERTMLDTIQRLLSFCRGQGIEVIYVRHNEDDPEGLLPGSDSWQIYHEIAPQAGERIFDKRRSSSFYQTGLKEYLKEKGVDTVIIVGMQTDYCIDATIKAGFEHGFQILIPENGNSTYDNRYMTAEQLVGYYNRMIWNGRFGELIGVDALFERLGESNA